VEGCELGECLDPLEHPPVDASGRSIPATAMDDPMPNGVDILAPTDLQRPQQAADRSVETMPTGGVSAKRHLIFRDGAQIEGVDDAALERARAGVQDENAQLVRPGPVAHVRFVLAVVAGVLAVTETLVHHPLTNVSGTRA